MSKVAQNEKRKTHSGYLYLISINMSSFESFHWVISASINLLFLKCETTLPSTWNVATVDRISHQHQHNNIWICVFYTVQNHSRPSFYIWPCNFYICIFYTSMTISKNFYWKKSFKNICDIWQKKNFSNLLIFGDD